MIRTSPRLALFIAFGWLTVPPLALAQSVDSPMTRLRPIGTPSAVDQYRSPTAARSLRETAYQREVPVRQADFNDPAGALHTVRQQQFDAPLLPGSMQLPDSFTSPTLPPSIVTPTLPPGPAPFAVPPPVISTPVQPIAPRGLPINPANLAPVPSGPIASNSDLAPLAQPQLNDGFATVGNCPCVSPPSGYVAASGPCSPVSYLAPASYLGPQAYVAPPTQISAPVVVPAPPVRDRRAGIPRGPLFSFGQNRNPVQVGRGIVGQPVAYVPGQRIRNWIRYIFP